jgi:hypothetical protein
LLRAERQDQAEGSYLDEMKTLLVEEEEEDSFEEA